MKLLTRLLLSLTALVGLIALLIGVAQGANDVLPTDAVFPAVCLIIAAFVWLVYGSMKIIWRKQSQ